VRIGIQVWCAAAQQLCVSKREHHVCGLACVVRVRDRVRVSVCRACVHCVDHVHVCMVCAYLV